MTPNLPEAKKTSKQKKLDDADPLSFLYGRGAHFVLCLENKRPLWGGWQKTRPPLDVCREHDGPLGLIPYSIQTTALDVDQGDPVNLLKKHPALASIASRKRGGLHCYYDDDQPRGNRDFSLCGCGGQVRGARGYLVLWNDAAERLADAIASPPKRSVPFPSNLFEAAGIEEPGPSFKPTRQAPADPLRLQKTHPGERHQALFDSVRSWAYEQEKGGCLKTWKGRVRAFAWCENDLRFPIPYGQHPGDSGREPDIMAESIATWTWSGGKPLDCSPPAQRRRGMKSGQARRAAVADKDALVVAAFEGGASIHAISKMDGRARPPIRHVLRREIPLLLLDTPPASIEAIKPWDYEGISRRTWYRRRAKGESEGRK